MLLFLVFLRCWLFLATLCLFLDANESLDICLPNTLSSAENRYVLRPPITMADFDIAAYMGFWYQTMSTAKANADDLYCITFQLELLTECPAAVPMVLANSCFDVEVSAK